MVKLIGVLFKIEYGSVFVCVSVRVGLESCSLAPEVSIMHRISKNYQKNRTWIRFHAAFEVINPLLLNIMLRPVVMYIRTIMI